MAPRSSPRRSNGTGKKPKETKKSKSVNGKSSPKRTKPRALNHEQYDVNEVRHNRPPQNMAHSVSSAKKKTGAVAHVTDDAESHARVDDTQPKKKKTLVSAKEGAPVRRKILKKSPPPAVRKEPPESSSYDDSENDDDEDDEDDEVLDPAVAVRGHSGTTVGVDDDSDEDESDLEEASRAHKRKKQRKLYRHEGMVQNEEEQNQAEWGDTGRRCTSPSAGDTSTSPSGQRKKNGESIRGSDKRIIVIRAMSKAEGQRNQERHIAERVKAFVINRLFRKIKFVTNDAMVHEAMTMIMDQEDVPQHKRFEFQTIYTWTFNFALNSKRSTCETAGKKCVVDETWPKFKKLGKKLFTIEELCKLRRAETEREQEAFFWFFGEFLECVCGARHWGKQKEHQLISKATLIGTREKIVTKSDEAFALLLYENYIDKWKKQGNIEDDEDEQYEDCAEEDEKKEDDDDSVHSAGSQKKKTISKAVRGKYTCHNNGTMKYGGWSDQGMTRFNELYDLVKEDRRCRQAAAMEKEFLERAVWNSSDRKRRRTNSNVAATVVGELVDVRGGVVQPAWESDDESTS